MDKPVRYLRKVIKIRGQDSPNVRIAEAQIAAGMTPTNEMIFPGVLSYADYVKRRTMWTPQRQRIGLDAEFPDGEGIMLFPEDWLIRAEQMADKYKLLVKLGQFQRQAKSIGIDPAEGGDHTVMTAGDEFGVIEQDSVKTPDTTVVTSRTIAFGTKHGVPPSRWVFDRGGGGKQHADRLRLQGYPVQTVFFGESITPPIRSRTFVPVTEKREIREQKYTYFNRRSQMYGAAHLLLDPSYDRGFAIPVECAELHRQLSLIPEVLDPEGRLKLPPKSKKSPNSTEPTLSDIIGCSPDEADSFVLMVYGLSNEIRNAVVGAMWDVQGLEKWDPNNQQHLVGAAWDMDDQSYYR